MMLRMIACVMAASALISVGSHARADGGLFGLPTPALSVNIAALAPPANLLAGGPGCGHHRGVGNYYGSFYRGGYGGGYYNNYYPPVGYGRHRAYYGGGYYGGYGGYPAGFGGYPVYNRPRCGGVSGVIQYGF